MRFVPIRSIGHQAILMHHKVRELLVSQRTQLLNALRGHLAEVGVIAAQGPNGAYALAAAILGGDSSVPLCVRDALAPIVRQLQTLNDEIAASDRAILELAKADRTARRLMSVPGIGPITASAIAASVQDVGAFSGPRSSQRSSDWRRNRTRREAKSALDVCQKWEIAISESCWSSAPTLSSSTEGPTRMDSEHGQRSSWKPSRSSSSPWRWRTGLQGSPSPSCAMALSTGMPWPDRGRPRLSG
jgi:Transposase IS116/IS110/IS902 family